MATAHEGRTYHNTAILLHSGQILVGGHAPISTLDTFNFTIPGGFTEQFRNPTFEIYNPPYMYWGPQPTIGSVSSQLRARREREGRDTAGERNRLGRAGAQHSAHAPRRRDQRNVELPITSRTSKGLEVSVPSSSAVLPPGPYMLFVNRRTPKGLQPSAGYQLTLN